MKFRKYSIFLSLLFVFVCLTGCNKNNYSSFQQGQVGASGLIAIDKRNIPIEFGSDIHIEIIPDFEYEYEHSKDAILIFPLDDLQVGAEFEIKFIQPEGEHTLKEIVRSPCLTYLAGKPSNPEIWGTCGEEPIQLTQTAGHIVDYAVAKNGDWIIYGSTNDEGGIDIWKMGRMGENPMNIFSCGEKICDQLAVNSQGSQIAFRSYDGEEDFYLLTIESNELILVEKGKISNVDFSPDDSLLRYFENTNGFLRVFNLKTMKLIFSLKSDSDLIGEWKKDSGGFMFGQYNNWGGIARMDLREVDIFEKSESLIIDGAESSIYLYEPSYMKDGKIIALTRNGFNADRKQIWQLDKSGEKIFEITNDYRYSHSMITWNSIDEILAFQRFAHTGSDAVPEIWVWDKSGNSLRLIEANAAHAEWVY
jgi:WD40 repeat protein